MGIRLGHFPLAAATAAALWLAVAAASAGEPATAPLTSNVQAYIIKFVEPGVLRYAGGVEGLSATAPASTGSRRLAVHSDEVLAYSKYLASRRQAHVSAIEQVLGHELSASHSYHVLFNGVAAALSANQAARLAALPGVSSIRPAGTEHLATYRGPAFIGADQIWNGSATPAAIGYRGEGIRIGLLDSGSNSNHPSFANDPDCGFSALNPKLTAVDCSSTDSISGACNGSNPEANAGYGHGVHTASTAAGNTIDNSVTPAPDLPNGVSMSGVAPCAYLNHYKVCETTSCSGDAIIAAIENAILDQVDVLSFSISGGMFDPWSYAEVDRYFLDALSADLMTVAAAGNTTAGMPDPVGMVNHRGPWMLTVAASTQDRMVGPVLGVTGPGIPPAELASISLTPGSTSPAIPALSTQPIRTWPANLPGCTATGGIPGGSFSGAIAVLRRGQCSFSEKIANAANAGALMVLIANNVGGALPMNTGGAPAVPNAGIDMASGDALIAFVGANPGSATADTGPFGIGATEGDILAGFSLRGPISGTLENLTKPDITGPGVRIYAALDDASGQYGFKSGTSMATPHLAGAAALLRGIHPGWSAAEIKSALMTTAQVAGLQDDGIAPWTADQVGSGRVDLTMAALAGLTLDVTQAEYLAANPNGGSIPYQSLNLPSLRDASCTPTCSWTRTVTNRLGVSATWSTSFVSTSGPGFLASVMPQSFTLAPGASQSLTITASPMSGAVMPSLGFGRILFAEGGGLSPDQHFSVVIQGRSDIIFQHGFE